MNESCVHIYYGDGKGKTTAALGLAMRAVGQGVRVVVVQFLKNTPCGEVNVLRTLPGVTLLRGKPNNKFTFAMTPDEKAETKAMQTEHLRRALELVAGGDCEMLVLDEALDVWVLDLVDRALLRGVVEHPPTGVELVLTGHDLPDWMAARADYMTHMTKEKHPYDRGLAARCGVEY